MRNPAIKELCFAEELCSAATGTPDRHYSCLHFFHKIIALTNTSYIVAAFLSNQQQRKLLIVYIGQPPLNIIIWHLQPALYEMLMPAAWIVNRQYKHADYLVV